MTQRKTEAAKGKPWTAAEQSAAIAAYNAMMRAERKGEPYNKAAINRWLRDEGGADKHPPASFTYAAGNWRGSLAARSRGSIEAKFMNISSARESIGLPVLDGYKAAGNYQRSLVELIQSAEG